MVIVAGLIFINWVALFFLCRENLRLRKSLEYETEIASRAIERLVEVQSTYEASKK